MDSDSFVHLHLHTEYSMLDGSIRTGDLMRRVKELGMPAVAMTDHGNMLGAIDFYKAANAAGVKPIIGCELYVAPRSMRDRQASSARDAAYHLTVLCQNDVGYHNLLRLVSAAQLDGFYHKPRVDKELLAAHSDGLVALSGCLKGEINVALASENEPEARRLLGLYVDIFGRDRFYVELHDHGMAQQEQCNRGLVALAREFDLRPVAANDVHFLELAHHESHDVMVCIGTNARVEDERRLRYASDLYLKSPAEMRALFAEIPGACDNTLRIAESCDLKIKFNDTKYPEYTPPDGLSKEEYVRQLCERGLRERYGERAMEDPTLATRLDYELRVIAEMGFTSYFLIVWDFVRFAKEQGIPVGPGRGSAAGSLVAYTLGITNLDPIRFGLLFERFLNPDRVSPPDIDIDFCQSRRGEVIDYVRRRYGERCVAQIVTVGTLGAKSVVRDVSRALGLGYSDGDRIAKLIPNDLKISLADAAEKNPELREVLANEEMTRRVWEHSLLLEGLARHAGTHAAGVVIGDRDLSEHVPLIRGKEGEVLTQYDGEQLTDLGLLKMDFLGLRTLTVIEEAIQLIRELEPTFDVETVPEDDPAAYALLNRGETVGVFQLESPGMREVCMRMEATNLDDLMALIALYRPGPMKLIDDYIQRKRGKTRIRYEHPLLEKVCAETYGILIYQEQVQQAASLLAGYSLAQADLLRRAMGKKSKTVMAAERERFVKGCAEHNRIPADRANAIFDLLEKFAGYGFNKSHSAAYAILSFRTAYLKAHHPLEFMAATLSSEHNNLDKISGILAECQRMRIPILGPDINRSELRFRPERDSSPPAIRFGLSAIKNVGEAAMEVAIANRREHGAFTSIEDFAARLDSRTINRKILESLVRCGAFDAFGGPRPALFSRIEPALAASSALQRDRASGQATLFELSTLQTTPANPDQTPEWTKEEELAQEKELLGFYVSGHPLDAHREKLDSPRFTKIAMLGELSDRAPVEVAGTTVSVERRFTKKENKPFAVVILEDLTGQTEITIWSETLERHRELIEKGKIVAISGRIDGRTQPHRVVASEIALLSKTRPPLRPVLLELDAATVTREELEEISSHLAACPGRFPVDIVLRRSRRPPVKLRAGREYQVDPSPELRERLARWWRDG